MIPPKTFKSFYDLDPNEIYTAGEAARYLGIHRCTIYSYITNPERPLPCIRMLHDMKRLFRGADLISYKAAGLPKRGRPRRGGKR